MYIDSYLTQQNTAIDELNDLDALVLAVFAYLPIGFDMVSYSSICTNNLSCISKPYGSIANFTSILMAKEEILRQRFAHSDETLKNYKNFIKSINNNDRYKNIKILDCFYKNNDNTQFAGYLFDIGKYYVLAFRGTDGTKVGWCEDFMMLEGTVGAQSLANETLAECLNKYKDKEFYITGHSKGGNLSAYSTIKNRSDRIKCSYNFDGPGFNSSFLQENKISIALCKHKLKNICIETTVVGSLLFGQDEIYAERYFVKTKSKLNFLEEHSPFYWIIEDNNFVISEQTLVSKEISKQLKHIASKANDKEMWLITQAFLTTLK